MANNPTSSHRTKKNDFRHHFARQAVQQNNMDITYIGVEQQHTDVTIKPLTTIDFQGQVKFIMMFSKLLTPKD